MKKIILFLFSLISLFLFDNSKIRVEAGISDQYFNYPMTGYKATIDGVEYVLQKSVDGMFRVSSLYNKAYYFTSDGYNYYKAKLFTDGTYLFLALGDLVIVDEIDHTSYSYPVFIILDKDLNLINKIVIDDCILEEGFYSYGQYVYRYENYYYFYYVKNLDNEKVVCVGKYDLNLNFINSTDIPFQDYVYYQVYDLMGIYYYIDHAVRFYVDPDLNIYDSYTDIIEYNGKYELTGDYLVNNELMNKGSLITLPGKYKLSYSDKKYSDRVILIKPVISFSGEKDGDYFKDYVDYSFSGGTLYINNEVASLKGTISIPGEYKFRIVGYNNYYVENTITIKPKLDTLISDGGTLSIGDKIYFSGICRLNDNLIENGYEIEEAGDYTLELFVGDTVIESYSFIVKADVITVKEKTLVYNIMIIGLSVACLFVTILLIIDMIKQRRMKKKIGI